MNYGGGGAAGGPGQYGQPPMGGPGQAGGMPPMGMGGGGPMPQHPHMMMQQGAPQSQAQMQQRMMQMPQQGMRQMYAQPGMQAQQGHMPMYPQQAHMMQKQMSTQEIISRFPPEWKVNLSRETNHERKNNLFKQYFSKFVELHQSNRMSPQGMVPGARGQVPQMYGNQMFPGPSHPAGVNPQHGPGPMPGGNAAAHMANASMRGPSQPASVMSMQGGPNSVNPGAPHSQQQQVPVPSPQIAALSNQQAGIHAGSPAGLNASMASVTGASPQIGSHLQPATPQGPASVQQPGSVGDVSSMQQPPSIGQQETTPEYEQLRAELHDKYREHLKRIGERCSLDNLPKPAGYDRLLEILDRRRNIPMEMLRRVAASTASMVEKQSLGYSFIAEVRRYEAEKSESPNPTPTLVRPDDDGSGPDPWKPLRHLFLRVPDHIQSLCEETGSSELTRKRPLSSSLAADEPATKQMKIEAGGSGVLPGLRRISRRVNSVDEEEYKPPAGDDQANVHVIEIDCTFDSKKWKMSVAATQELGDLPWRVDPECLPSTCKSPDVTICFDSKMLVCPPLRVLVPATYPLDPPVVQFDRSFPIGGPLSAQLATMFERSLSILPSRSLTCIYEAFRSACQELMRLKGAYNGHYVPNKHQQKQLVA